MPVAERSGGTTRPVRDRAGRLGPDAGPPGERDLATAGGAVGGLVDAAHRGDRHLLGLDLRPPRVDA